MHEEAATVETAAATAATGAENQILTTSFLSRPPRMPTRRHRRSSNKFVVRSSTILRLLGT